MLTIDVIKKFLQILLIIVMFESPINSQTSDSIILQPELNVELCIIDFPYFSDAVNTVCEGKPYFGGYFAAFANPSMHQSLSLTSSLYSGLHYGINKLFRFNADKSMSFMKKFLYNFTVIGADWLLLSAPGFDGWLHEEYHRAVMTRFQVNSFNDMNLYPLFESAVSVSHVKDIDLVRLKQESPSDFVRMHVAGIEGEYLLVDDLQKKNFFYDQFLPHEFISLLATINSISYVRICSQAEVIDPETDYYNKTETDVEERDFTGFDFLAYTYDLFRPNEAYQNRGIHPLGNGIDRYIKTTDLTTEELDYLWMQGNLQWLNIVSPMLFGFRQIAFPRFGFYGNFALHHYLTSFGNDISCNVFIKTIKNKFIFSYHHFQNYERSFPAIEMQMIDVYKKIGSYHLIYTPRIILGFQPYHQAFKTLKSDFLGLAECCAEIVFDHFAPFIELSAKTNCWVAGNEFLSSNFSMRFGLKLRF